MTSLAGYYAKRAAEYERIYCKPERQADLALLRVRLCELLAGSSVLELACGTGWWTEALAPHAAHVTALDINEEMLYIARAKSYPQGRVTFLRGDCYAPPELGSPGGRLHDALLAAFWWSHVPLAQLNEFLRSAERAIAPGGLLVFLDNAYVEGSSTPISRRDAEGNTYQVRGLDDGSTHEVLKNFPAGDELRGRAAVRGREITIERFEYYWLLRYRTKIEHG